MELRPLAVAFALACIIHVPAFGAFEETRSVDQTDVLANERTVEQQSDLSPSWPALLQSTPSKAKQLQNAIAAASMETSESASGEPSNKGSRRKQLDKLKMATFTKYQARLLLPIQYQRKDENSQLTAMGADIPHGIFMFMSMRAPDKIPLNPAAIKPIIKGIIEGMKAECEVETPLKLGEYEGLECRGKVKVDADVEAIVRGYVADRRMYFVTVMGTGPWIRSNTVKRYLDSFQITP